jgi:anti-sigma factor RsiW
MSLDRGRHEPFEELISASLHGDLTGEERRALDAHLDGCERCRETLAAFSDQRRIVAGLRHLAPPRDLEARVRTGAENAGASRPWWRRPPAIFAGVGGGLAVVAGALLALVLLNGSPDEPPVGETSPSASVMVSQAPIASQPVTESSAPSASPAEPASAEPEPSVRPTPPGSIGWGAINYLRWEGTLADQRLALYGFDPATETTAPLLDLEVAGRPVAPVFSPDSAWLAYQVALEGRGTNRIVVVHLPTGESHEIGETPDASVFSERMTWSPDSRYLAYTSAEIDAGVGPDAWVFDANDASWARVTESQSTYAASFVPFGTDAGALWVSEAGAIPSSHLVTPDDLADGEPGTVPERSMEFIFQPILSPSGEHAIFWRGSMRPDRAGWTIDTGGMLYLSGEPVDGGPSWSGEELFPTLVVDQDALGSARVTWSYDADWFAVFDVQWRGTPQTDAGGNPFPRMDAVYFGRAAERMLIDEGTWIDVTTDVEMERPVDVAFVPYDFGGDVPSVAVTVFEAPAGESGDSPVGRARLVLAPAGGFGGAVPEVDSEAEWVGLALYVPQGDEVR